MDYWKECIAEAFEDAQIIATEEQINSVASWAEGAHENYSMAHGYDCIPNPIKIEKDEEVVRLKREIKRIEGVVTVYRQSVANRRNVPLEDVCIEDGDVIYGRALGR